MEELLKNAEKEFTLAAIQKQFAMCATKSNYKAGIFVLNLYDTDEILQYFYELYQDYILRMHRSCYRTEIYFANGSYILCNRAHESSKGRRLHSIIYDMNIDTEIKNACLLPMFIPYDLANDTITCNVIGVNLN